MHIPQKSLGIKQFKSCRHSAHRPGASRVSLALAGAVVSLALANPAHAQHLFALRGHGSIHPGVTQARALAPLNSGSTLDLAISLPVHNEAQLDQYLQDIYNPGSSNYRKYLSSAEFNSKFGPTEDDYAKVASFLKAHGFTVKRTYANRMIVDAGGSISSIEQAFHVKMYRYQHPTENRTFFGPDREPTVDAQVPILDVVGLDNYELPRPKSLHLLPGGRSKSSSGSSPYGTYIGKDFRAAYTPGSSLDGTGQTIALFQLGSYYPGDISSYCSTAGIPSANITEVLLDGVSATPGSGADTLEQSLDIEMAHSMAPGANIRFYYGTNAADVWNQIASDNIANSEPDPEADGVAGAVRLQRQRRQRLRHVALRLG
jgi:subtilase family serine protease